ncbi:MAG TPA: MFS transporter [Burkholderiales bacterium]|nr:MFS transporter [Burkholderiales bacterium]
MTFSDRMSPLELRASMGLASIFGLRMLGMFVILPVFALYAEHLPGGDNRTLVGIALGAYGLTQAILQIPLGWLSDRVGRKAVIYGGLIMFAIGSFVAAAAHDIYLIIFGRVLQGAGAISAAVIAMAADLTREQHRTKAMALIGSTIGLTFALSLVVSPLLNRWIGVPGIFAMTGVLALLAILVILVMPSPQLASSAERDRGKFIAVLRDGQLLRLNYGIFALHAALMALFLIVPFSLRKAGLGVDHHWKIYLPVMLASFVVLVPAIVFAEKKARIKQVFCAAVALMLATQLLLPWLLGSLWEIFVALLAFFAAFNILEAMLPSLISKLAPVGAKGTAIGVYSSVQFFGAFVGAAMGGYLAQHYGNHAVFGFCVLLFAVWFIVAFGMKVPGAVETKMYPIPAMDTRRASGLSRQLASVPGVKEVLVLAAEGVAYLQVDSGGFDEQNVIRLIAGEI